MKEFRSANATVTIHEGKLTEAQRKAVMEEAAKRFFATVPTKKAVKEPVNH